LRKIFGCEKKGAGTKPGEGGMALEIQLPNSIAIFPVYLKRRRGRPLRKMVIIKGEGRGQRRSPYEMPNEEEGTCESGEGVVEGRRKNGRRATYSMEGIWAPRFWWGKRGGGAYRRVPLLK